LIVGGIVVVVVIVVVIIVIRSRRLSGARASNNELAEPLALSDGE
jgi:hypothetical protein